MTVLTRWEPFREFRTLQNQMNRLFQDTLGQPGREEPLTSIFSPAVDVYEDDHNITLKIEVLIPRGNAHIADEHGNRLSLFLLRTVYIKLDFFGSGNLLRNKEKYCPFCLLKFNVVVFVVFARVWITVL